MSGNDYTSSQKKKVNSSEVGDKVRTPTDYPADFTKNGKNYVNKKTGEIWQKSNTNHSGDAVGEWKVGVGGNEPTKSKKITIGASDGKILKVDK